MKKINIGLLTTLIFTSCTTNSPLRSIASTQNNNEIFKDITATSNIDTKATSTVIAGDYNNDGFVDVIVHSKLYKNITTSNKILFQDVTEEMGLKELKGLPMFLDINNDRKLDIITTKGQIFIQKNNSYKEVSRDYKLTMAEDAFTLSFGDLNNDGYPDLLVGRREIYKDNTFTFVPPQVFINVRGISFIEISDQVMMKNFPAYVRGIAWADYNNDQYPDIYYSNYRLRQNFLFQVKDTKMTDVAQSAGVQGEFDELRYFDDHYKKRFGPLYGHTIGSVWSDLDNDGDLDLWVSNLVHKFVGVTNKQTYDYRGYVCDDSKVYQNLGAPDYKFKDMRKTSQLPEKPIADYPEYKGDELWAHSTAADYDNDGLQDMYVSQVYNLNYSYSLLFKNLGNFKFKNVTNLGPKLHDTYAGAWADLNNDGKMDLIVSGRSAVNATPQIHILENISENDNNFLRVKLIGVNSGTIPVTTQVRLFHDDGLFMKQVEGVTGTYNQQNDPTLHFGLGRISTINAMEIIWSSGKKQVIKNIQVNKTYTITEGIDNE